MAVAATAGVRTWPRHAESGFSAAFLQLASAAAFCAVCAYLP